MRAAFIESYGQTPTITDLPEPEVDAPLGTVLAAGINPVDLTISGGEYYAIRPKPPYTPGMEGVARRADGSLVYFSRPGDLKHGSLAQQVTLDDEQSFVLGNDTDPIAAVGCGIAGISSWMAVNTYAQVKEGDKVVIVGATGAAGLMAVQAAKLAGASQIVAIGRNEARLARAQELGATDTIRFHVAMYYHQVEIGKLTGGGHDVTIDFTWGPPAQAALMSSAKHARFVNVGNSAAPGSGISAGDLRALDLTLRGFSIWNQSLASREQAFNELLGHVQAGRVQLDAETVGLDDVPSAWERQATSPGTKLVVATA
ncbi:MAG: zinc-binding alcohol dehydrogenase family protein [Solirubrobacteraceae bacterium]|nr:zinc-binding alcohol dehydrogenase family protein [Patulibacter sp.]